VHHKREVRLKSPQFEEGQRGLWSKEKGGWSVPCRGGLSFPKRSGGGGASVVKREKHSLPVVLNSSGFSGGSRRGESTLGVFSV